MGGLATRIWRSWWGPKLVSKRSEARSAPLRVPNWAPISRDFFSGNRAAVRGNRGPISRENIMKNDEEYD